VPLLRWKLIQQELIYPTYKVANTYRKTSFSPQYFYISSLGTNIPSLEIFVPSLGIYIPRLGIYFCSGKKYILYH